MTCVFAFKVIVVFLAIVLLDIFLPTRPMLVVYLGKISLLDACTDIWCNSVIQIYYRLIYLTLSMNKIYY